MNLTARQTLIVEVVTRHNGNFAAAARELGTSASAVAETMRRAAVRQAVPEPRAMREMLTYKGQVASYGPRLVALEERLETIEDRVSSIARLLADLAVEIRAWTDRQPIYVEMRPRHQRVVDGGQGGVKEARALRKVAGE